MKTITNSQYENLKRAAKRLKKDLGITNSEALERVAMKAGFQNYHQLQQLVSNPRPHQGKTSSVDDSCRQVAIDSGEIWFALDVKDAEKYDHATFPKRWGIKEDREKWNTITEDIEKALPEIEMDEDHPAQQFYRDTRIFSLALSQKKTLFDVVSYVREIFFWEPTFVFQTGIVYECFENPMRRDYRSWIREFGNPQDETTSENNVQ